jgi:hypothetical protein
LHEPAKQWSVICLLLLLCLAKGIWFVHGLTVPPDADMIRDVGFIQAALDGNFTGDPTNANALRWYPPLIHVLAAGAVRLAGASIMSTWIQAGLWTNLLSPLMFFVMNRRLIGPWPAVAATIVFVLYGTATMPPDAAAGYTPFTFTPSLAWPMFFAAVWLIHARADARRFGSALLIGAMLGIVFLVNTVPAILLSAIVAAVAIARDGLRSAVLFWLVCVAVAELAFAAPFLAPLIVAYHLHIVNPVPGGWVHELLTVPPLRKWLIGVNLPGILALAVVALRRGYGLERVSAVIFATWIAACVFFLVRHMACFYLGQAGGVCGVFVIAVHHYHAYLQAAWASLIGLALCRLMGSLSRTWRWPVRAALAAAIFAGLVGFVTEPWSSLVSRGSSSMSKRASALANPDTILNLEAYHWILANTAPQALFVTPRPGLDASPSAIGPEAATVIAAGRRLVAAPEAHANPYIEWPERNAQRVRYLSALSGGPEAAQALCELLRQADARAGAYFLLPNGTRVTASTVAPMFIGGTAGIYRVADMSCAPSR